MKKLYDLRLLTMLFLMSLVSFGALAQAPISVTGYFFQTETNGNLSFDKDGNPLDMSTGSTVHLGPGTPASGTSPATNATSIPWPAGFAFSYPTGTAFDQAGSFAVASNGLIGLNTTGAATITTGNNISGGTGLRMGSFVTGLSNGGVSDSGVVHSKVFGSSPNQVLVIEFKNMRFINTSTVPAGDVTHQVRFYETSNLVEFVYGEMSLGAGSSTAARAGFSTGSTAATSLNVNFATHTAAAVTTANTFNVVGPLAPFAGSTPTTRRVYRFSPTGFPQVYTSASFLQEGAAVQPATSNAVMARLQVEVSGNLSPFDLTSINLNSGSTNLANINNIKVYYTGTNASFSDTAQYGTTVSPTGATTSITGSRLMMPGTNYFWVVYDVAAGASIGDTLRLSITDFVLGGVSRTPALSGVPAVRVVSGPLSGTYTVGAGGSFPNFNSAFGSVNVLGLSGNVTFEVISNITEPTAAVLNQWTEVGTGNYTMTIKPVGGAYTVSAGPTASGTGVFNVLASRVTIDGEIGGVNSLSFENNTPIGTLHYGIHFNSVSDVTIRNVNVRAGGNNSTTLVSAIQVGGSGNSNILIENNQLGRANRGVNVEGVTGNVNTGVIVRNNMIGNTNTAETITLRGINVAHTNNYQIQGNTIADMVTTQTTMRAIHVEGNSSGGVVSGNTIRNIEYTATSFSGGQGIVINSTNSNLDVDIINNSISGLKGHGSGTRTNNAWGIIIWNHNNARIVYNSINISDDRLTTSSAPFDGGILIHTATSTGIDVINNMISVTGVPGNVGGKMFGIFSAGANPFGTISNNNFHVAATAQHFVGHNAADRVSIADWMAATPDTNSISADPVFVSVTNLTPQSPNVSQLGIPVAGITTDITGATRNATTPDMGAIEFVPATAICFTPSGLAGVPAGSSAIAVNWASNGTETAWDVEYDTTGFTQGSGTVLRVNGTPGTTISGLTFGQSYSFYVRAVCDTATNFSSAWVGPVSVTINYCASGATISADSKIDLVVVGNDSVASPPTVCATYTDYTSLPPFQMSYGVPTPIQVHYGRCGGTDYASFSTVYIDFNNDLVFDPVTELVASGNSSAGAPLIATANVPTVAQHLGTVRMRVVLRESGSASLNAPCGTFSYGETQDFLVNMNPAPSCVGVSNLAANPAGATSASVSFTPDAAHQAFEVEYGAVGFTQGAGTLVNATASPVVISGLTAGASYSFYVRGICDTTNNTAGPWAGPVSATLAYCASNATSTADSRVGLVVVNGDSVASPVGPGNCATYTDNTALPAFQLTYSTNASFQVHYGTCGSAYASYATVYIDFNNDLVFDPVTELVASGAANAGAPLIASYTMPVTGMVGTTRMRVVLNEGGSASINAPCGTYSWGETQDYTVNLNPAPSLDPFALLSPPNNTVFTVTGPAISTVDVSWQSSVAGATYTWLLDVPGGNFSSPLASLPANNNGTDTVVSIQLGAIDALLASLNLNLGDTAQTIWTVRARSGTDSILATAPFNLSLIRGAISNDTVVNPFNLISPPNNTVLTVAGASATPVGISWNAATTNNGAPVTYTWLLDAAGANFSNPVAAVSSGSDTTLTLNFGAIDGLLASLGLSVGDSINTIWTVRANSGTNDTLALQTFNLRLHRGAVTYPPLTVLIPAAGGGTSGLGRGPVTQNNFHRSAAVYAPAEVATQLAPGQQITHVGYQISAPAAAPVRGFMRYYMVNTNDATFTRSATWADLISSPTAMTLVYEDSLTIPNVAGVYQIPLDTAFTYTGGGLYVAYEWQITSALSTSAVYLCNTAIPGAQRNAQDNTAFPASLTGASAFRPQIVLTAPRLANDLEVVELYTMGKLPIPSGLPHTIQAIIRNNSSSPVVGRSVSLNITGANTFTASETVNLGVGASTTVNFTGYAPANLGFNNIVVSLGADNNNLNNQKTYVQETTAGTFSYADTSATNFGVGFNAGSGILAVRHTVTGTRAVERMRARINLATTAVGGRVRGVVMNSMGQIVASTPDTVLSAANLGQYLELVFDTSYIVTDNDFFVGLLQTPKTPGYFPMMYQAESPLRPSAFFTSDTTGGGLGFLGGTSNFRFIVDVVTIVPASAQDSLSAFNLIGPANNATLNITGTGGQTANVNWERSVATTGNPTTYEWLLDAPGGNFSTPIVAIPANNNGTDSVLTLTFAAIDNLLATNGVPVGGSFTGVWTVRATSATLSRLAVAPRTITLNRGTVADTLSAFNLLTPANNTSLTIQGAVTQTANITWEASTFTGPGTTSYTWLLDLPTGNFSNPLASIPTTTNSLTLTFEQIRDLLIANNIPVGITAQVKWTVRAQGGSITRSANASFNLNIVRGVTNLDSLSAFNLLSPANNATRTLENDPTQTLNFNYTISNSTFGGTVTYEFLVDEPSGDFSNPRMRVTGFSGTSATVSFQAISDSLGLTAGNSFVGKWTIRAVSGPVNRLATNVHNITFVRGVFTSVNDLNNPGALNLYPNPASLTAFLNINVPGVEAMTVKIMNAVGQEVYSQVYNTEMNGGLIELDLASLQQGMYFVRVSDGKHVGIRRLMIQR
ncbi:MAG: SusE domain-containing protein [Bacteroidia bacterium]